MVPKKKTNKKTNSQTAIGTALRALGGLGGGTLGGYLGNSSLGAAAGTGLGAMVSKWLGQGEYTVTSNSLVNRVRSSGDIPSMHRSGQSVVIRHKEYITDVYSSIGFNVPTSYALNPGLAASFPWLSTIAQQYQEYTWKGIVYEFVSTSGDVVASTNTALGSIMMATQYKSTAGTFLNKQQLLNEYFSSDAKPSECFCHPIECDPKENPYNVQYVRAAAVPTGEDAKTYDLGTMYLATQGMQASAIDIGEIWVSYEVELRKPVMAGALNIYAEYFHSQGANPSSGAALGLTRTVYFNSLGITVGNNLITFPAGTIGSFLLNLSFIAATANNMTNWVTGGVLVNCTSYYLGGNLNGNIANYTVGTGTSTSTVVLTITDATKQASFAVGAFTLAGSTIVDVLVTQLPINAS